MEDLLFLDDVCERYPTKLRKIEIVNLQSELTEPLSRFPKILRRLTHLDVPYPGADLSSIKAICKQYPVKLSLTAELLELTEILENPGLLKSLDRLSVEASEQEELTLLDDICQRCPDLSGVYIDIYDDLQHLLTCSHVCASLKSLNVCLSHENDIVLLKSYSNSVQT